MTYVCKHTAHNQTFTAVPKAQLAYFLFKVKKSTGL